MRIPIKALKEIAKEYNLSHVILFAHHPGEKKDHIITYGKSVDDCSQAADFGNLLKDYMGWPEKLHSQPSRVKRIEKQLRTLRKETLRKAAEAVCAWCRNPEWKTMYCDPDGNWRHRKAGFEKDGGQYCKASAILNLENEA